MSAVEENGGFRLDFLPTKAESTLERSPYRITQIVGSMPTKVFLTESHFNKSTVLSEEQSKKQDRQACVRVRRNVEPTESVDVILEVIFRRCAMLGLQRVEFDDEVLDDLHSWARIWNLEMHSWARIWNSR